MTRATDQSKRKRAQGTPATGSRKKSLSVYPGWDTESGVFRLDASLNEIEERYRKIAEEAGVSAPAQPSESDVEEATPPSRR